MNIRNCVAMWQMGPLHNWSQSKSALISPTVLSAYIDHYLPAAHSDNLAKLELVVHLVLNGPLTTGANGQQWERHSGEKECLKRRCKQDLMMLRCQEKQMGWTACFKLRRSLLRRMVGVELRDNRIRPFWNNSEIHWWRPLADLRPYRHRRPVTSLLLGPTVCSVVTKSLFL